MHDWNVIVTAHEHRFAKARQLLETFGRVERTEFFNVLTLKVDDPRQFLEQAHRLQQGSPSLGRCVARVVPVETGFLFQSPEEFEAKAQAAVAPWVERLAGSRFHVRMHRRGFKGRIASQHEEQFLDHFLLERLRERGDTAHVDFDNPDFIIAVETVGQQAGLSLWSRDELSHYPLLKLD